MTFVLNVLHRDFSLIASDRRARSEGPSTLKIGKITVHAKGGITINGMQKLYSSRGDRSVVGVAGKTEAHGYVGDVAACEDPRAVVDLIRQHVDRSLWRDYAAIMKEGSFSRSQAIATFHGPGTELFFSHLFEFSAIHSVAKLWSGAENARLIWIGSGGDSLESAVGAEEVDRFSKSIRGMEDIDACVVWLRDAYEKVSAVDEHSGKEMVALVATATNPQFKRVRDRGQ